MKVRTQLKAGGYVENAQNQADKFFQDTDQFIDQVTQKAGQLTGAAADKLSRIWQCTISA